jgi:putative transposase
MPKKRYMPEAILQHLRTVERETGKGLAVRDACRTLGIPEHTDDRWKQADGGLRVNHAKRLKGLEQEPLRLKRRVADHARDLSILKEVALGNFEARPADAKPWGTPSPCSRCPSVERGGRSARSGPRLETCPGPICVERRGANGSAHWPRRTGGLASEPGRISCGARAGTWATSAGTPWGGTKASPYPRRSRSEPDSGAPLGRASGPRTAITSGRMPSWRIGRTTAGPFGCSLFSTSLRASGWPRWCETDPLARRAVDPG